jgi:hypothetical protein
VLSTDNRTTKRYLWPFSNEVDNTRRSLTLKFGSRSEAVNKQQHLGVIMPLPKTASLFAIAFFGFLGFSNPVLADVCADAKTQGERQITAGFQPFIDEFTTIIANINKQNKSPLPGQPKIDPRHVYDPAHNQWNDILQLLNDTIVQKQAALVQFDRKVSAGCLTPQTQAFLQTMLDAAAAYFTAGLSLALPERATHVDFNQILQGKPLGGPNSAVNAARDAAFNGLGMGQNNDLRKAVSDPINTTKTTVNNILHRAGLHVSL